MRFVYGTILVLSSLTAAAHADLGAACVGFETAQLSLQETSTAQQVHNDLGAKDWTSLAGLQAGDCLNGSFALRGRSLALPKAESSTHEIVRELPPDSGGASLLLLGLGTLGLLRAGRLAKQVHLGDVSEWVHTGGPWQIGNALAVDLSCDCVDLPLCVFERPSEGLQKICRGLTHEQVSVFLKSQWSVRSLPARAPPLQ